MRRRRGSGSIFKRASDDRWVCRKSTGKGAEGKRGRAQVTSALFCEAVREFSAMHPYRPEFGMQRTVEPRAEMMRQARERGRHTAQEWWALYRGVGGRCFYCDVQCASWPQHRRPTKDHRIPVSRGGSDSIGNIVVACKRCNSEKSTMTDVEFLAIFRPRLEASL